MPSGCDTPLRFWPGRPNTWGHNPFRKPLYRVIWSESRMYLLGGEFGDGFVGYRWAPYYGGTAQWVLEKWLSGPEYAGPRERWEGTKDHTGLYSMGPYPSTGWYEHCFSWPNGQEPDLEAIVPLLEYGKHHHSFAQIKTSLQLWHARKKKEWENRVLDQMKELQPAFGDSPTNLSPRKPTGDTAGLSSSRAVSEATKKYRGIVSPDSPPEIVQPHPRGVSMGQSRNRKAQ